MRFIQAEFMPRKTDKLSPIQMVDGAKLGLAMVKREAGTGRRRAAETLFTQLKCFKILRLSGSGHR